MNDAPRDFEVLRSWLNGLVCDGGGSIDGYYHFMGFYHPIHEQVRALLLAYDSLREKLKNCRVTHHA